jgi:carbon-monoxide dehydrogenase large subunit
MPYASGLSYRDGVPISYDPADYVAAFDRMIERLDYAAWRKEQAARRGSTRPIGIGVSAYVEGTGLGPFEGADVRVDPNGTVFVYLGVSQQGQGHETVFAQLVARELGIPMQEIGLRTAGADFYITGNATGGSRSLAAVGSVIMLAAREMVKKGMDLAAEKLEAAAADIEFVAGRYRIKGTDRSVGIVDLAKGGKLDVAYQNKFGSCFPNGCHIAEVEIEPETGIAEIVSYVACDDAGNIVNPQIVEGQVQGGLAQGAGQVFSELAVYDSGGQLLTGSFMDYAMPRAGLVSGIKLLEHPVPTKLNPLGAKGVGEAGVTGSMPALMNAVVDALRQVGVRRFEMPATPARVWKAIRQAGR